MKKDLYQEITDQIISDIETTGNLPWERPWKGGLSLPQNAQSKVPYSGLNVPILWSAQSRRGFESSQWLTYKQAQAAGGQVKKGEKATKVIFYKPLKITETDQATGETEDKSVPLLRAFSVFNLSQIDGLSHLLDAELKTDDLSEPERLEQAEKLIQSTKADIQFNGGSRAFYRPDSDSIHVPKREQFKGQHELYSTLFHELSHWTGHSKRLNRKLKNSFGTTEYAKEELTAELGAAFLCASVGLEYSTQHAAYVESWLKCLRDDKKFIFQASSKARQAADFIKGSASEK